jgi:hypothetical protein
MQRSDSIGALGAALAKAQAAIQPAAKDAKNPHFGSSYADLASVWEACRAHLAINGIAVVQSPEATDATVSLTTLLLHSSGEWLSGTLTARAKDAGPQSIGSTITYLRRYGLASMVGVAPDDDDAEGATSRGTQKPAPKPAAARQAGPPAEPTPPAPTRLTPSAEAVISDAQRKRLWAIAKGKDWTDEDIKKLLATKGYVSSKEIRVRDYDALVTAVQTGEIADDADDDDFPQDVSAPWEEGGR